MTNDTSVIASGTLTPSQSTPEYELAGSDRSMTDWTKAQVRAIPPRTGRIPMSSRSLALRRSWWR